MEFTVFFAAGIFLEIFWKKFRLVFMGLQRTENPTLITKCLYLRFHAPFRLASFFLPHF